jgi:hypothetical protein
MKTVNIPDSLHQSLKVIAAKRKVTVTQLVQDAIHAHLSGWKKP